MYSKDNEQYLEHLRHVFNTLREQKLFANLKKCHFLTENLVFLRYVISSKGINMDPNKIEVIIRWPTPRLLHDIQSFYGIASFYRQFIKGFNTIIAQITKCFSHQCHAKLRPRADDHFKVL